MYALVSNAEQVYLLVGIAILIGIILWISGLLVRAQLILAVVAADTKPLRRRKRRPVVRRTLWGVPRRHIYRLLQLKLLLALIPSFYVAAMIMMTNSQIAFARPLQLLGAPWQLLQTIDSRAILIPAIGFMIIGTTILILIDAIAYRLILCNDVRLLSAISGAWQVIRTHWAQIVSWGFHVIWFAIFAGIVTLALGNFGGITIHTGDGPQQLLGLDPNRSIFAVSYLLLLTLYLVGAFIWGWYLVWQSITFTRFCLTLKIIPFKPPKG